MLLIECPHCGPRDETEFHYGGEAHVPYPEDPSALSDQEWAHYLFYRENVRGVLAERWQHAAGCRKWFNALRNTVTYDFLVTYPAGAPRPSLPGDGNTMPDGAGSPPSAASPSSSSTTTPTDQEGSR